MDYGKRYGHLTYLGPTKRKGGYSEYTCDCGISSQLRTKYVTAGRVKTCGKCQLGRRLMVTRGRARPTGEKALHKLYNDAVTRGTNAGLPYESYISKIKEKCACCGSEPCPRSRGPKLSYNFVVIGKMLQVDTAPEPMTVCGVCRRRIGVQNPWEFLDYLVKCANNLLQILSKNA
jgi:hypothetical protein